MNEDKLHHTPAGGMGRLSSSKSGGREGSRFTTRAIVSLARRGLAIERQSYAQARTPPGRLTRLCVGLHLCCLALAAGAVTSAEVTSPPVQTAQRGIDTEGREDLEMLSYRSVAAALDAFDERRKLAPVAALRFRLSHKDGAPAGEADGLLLKLMINDTSIPVPIAADGRFSIARNRAAYDANANFVLNREKGLFIYRPDIRTPGLPENSRRLGDMRLECYVIAAAGKDQLHFLARTFITTMWGTTDWCGKKNFLMGFPAHGRLARVTIREGNRHESLSFDGAKYMVPIGPGKWNDEALIELEYVSTDTASLNAPQDTVQ